MVLNISQIMTRSVRTIGPEVTLGDALEKVKSFGKRHLIVTDPKTGKLLGLVSDRDIKKIISPFVGTPRETDQDKATLHLKVERIMIKNPYAVHAGEPLKHVVERLLEKTIGSAIVIDDDNVPIGIVTRTDLLRTLLKML